MKKTRGADFVSSREKREVVEGLTRCTRCKKMKPVSSFFKVKKSSTGLSSSCKKCIRSYVSSRSEDRRSRGVLQNQGKRICSRCNIEKELICFRILIGGVGGRYSVCKNCINSEERSRRELQNFSPDLSGEKVCSSCGLLKRNTEFYKFKHHKDGLDSACKACVQVRKADYFRRNAVAQLRCRIRRRLGYYTKCNKCLDKDYAILFLGCSLNELQSYLESKFYPDSRTGEPMTWNNYGRKGWHIDHIFPLSKADLLDDSEFKRVCHYTNLQPLWSWENLKKSSKVSPGLKSGALF